VKIPAVDSGHQIGFIEDFFQLGTVHVKHQRAGAWFSILAPATVCPGTPSSS
jgi:hypothetical protein